MEKTTLADKYLTFSEESKKMLDPEVVELLIDTFNKVYQTICDFFNNGEIRDVVFEPDPNFDSPPALIVITIITNDADGSIIERKMDNNKIKFNSNDKICQKGTRDIDWITHELIHVAQDYQYDNGNYPSWVVEGLADYGREKFGLYNKEADWHISKIISNKKKYDIGYTLAAGLFIWIEENYYSEFSKELNGLMKSGKYNDDYFIEKTNKTVDELWQIYVNESRVEACALLEEYIGEPLPDYVCDKIKSGELDDELDNYLIEKTGKNIDDLCEMYEL